MLVSLSGFVFYLSICILFVVPVFFIWHDVYEDGIIGRAALCGICGFAFMIGLQIVTGTEFNPVPETAWLIFSFSVFLTWHLFRFHGRILRQRKGEAVGA